MKRNEEPSCPKEPVLNALLLKYEDRIATLEEQVEELIDVMDLLEQKLKHLEDWIKE